MPNKDLTELIFILDRSGSMQDRVPDVIGGFNSLIEAQRKVPGSARVTLWLFDEKHDLLWDAVPIDAATPLHPSVYFARGSTALRDAIGRCFAGVGARLRAEPEEKRPGKVIATVMTDGFENASVEYDAKMLKDIITEQREKYGWQVLFVGANQDAMYEGEKIGVMRAHAMSFSANAQGAKNMIANVNAAYTRARGPGGQSISFTDEERVSSMVPDATDDK